MTPAAVAALLTDHPQTQEGIVRRIEAHPGVEPEAVLRGTEARIGGYGRLGLQPPPGTILFAVDATLDDLSGVPQNGSGPPMRGPGAVAATDAIPQVANATTMRVLQRNSARLRLEATPLGGGRASVLISRHDPPTRLLLDQGSLTSAKVRERFIEALPEDVRLEATAPLEDLGAEMMSTDGSSGHRKDLQGSAVEFEEPSPWPVPVDGAELLDEIARSIRRYVVMPEEAAIAAALWTVHTHALDAADVSPILGISSPAKRCGKTTLQCVLRRMVRRPLPATNISGSALFRTIERHEPTLLLDEADSYLTQNEEMRNLLNAGVRRDDAYVYRVVGDHHEPRRFTVFAPKTISLIGKLPETLEDRSIELRLERRRKTERVERLRSREARGTFEPLQRRAARWAADHLEELHDAEPAIPESLNDRAADFWEPLLAIADAAGGVWPGRARRAAAALSGDEHVPDESAPVLLLSDLREILAALGECRISSNGLTESLANIEERPWSTWSHGKPITQNQVARLLKRFDGVTSKTLRFSGGGRAKGYALESCQDAFDRYLPPLQDSEEREVLP